jgi:hypothetical protein
MTLDPNKLASDNKDLMKRGKAQNLSADQVAEALADAIHAYTSAAQVTDIAGSVDNRPFAQSGKGKVV